MCGTRSTFASRGPQVVKWFAGQAPVRPNDVQWISGAEFKRAFPSEARGFDYDSMKMQPISDSRTYALGAVGSSVRPITRRVIFVDTDKPTKCGAMCRNAKGPMCDCSCKGENHGASVAMSRARFAADDIDLKPTQQMADNAARGLELREKHGKGGTAVGVARARDIKNRANLSPETVKRMHAFFSRHEGNQAGGEDDAGYIAWMLWGGDAGKAWSARKAAQIDKNESARRAARKSTMANRTNDSFTVQLRWNGMGAPQHRVAFKTLAEAEKEAERLHRLYGSLGNPEFPTMKGIVEIEVHDTKQPWKNRTVRWFASRPGKAAFSNGERNRRMMQVLADADRRIANQVVSNIAAHYGIPTQQVFDEIFDAGAENLMDYVTEPVRSAASVILQKKGMMSRPGKATMAKREYVLWALPKGETDRMHEKPIAYNITKPADMERIKVEATKRGYHSFRVQVIEWNRPGAKARFNAASAWLAKYLSKVNEWWRDHTDYPTDLDASSDRGDIEGVLDDIAEHCREAVPREARPSWYAAAVRDMQKIPHARKAHMKNHFGIDRPMNVSQTASGGGTWTTKTERYGSKKATVEFYNKGGMVGSVYQDPDNPRLYKAFSEPDGREIASGSREACKAAVEKLAMSRPGAKAWFNKPKTVTVQTLLSGTGGSGGLFKVVGYDENGREYEYGLFAMRSMAEDKAKQIARYKDWSFRASRPGAKAKFNWIPETSRWNEVLNAAMEAMHKGDLRSAAAKIRDVQGWMFDLDIRLKRNHVRPGAKATHAAEHIYYTVAAHIGDQPAGERTTKSLDEAKAYAKAMLAALKPSAKGKSLVVDVYPVVNYSPQASILSLKASRPGAKAQFGTNKRIVRYAGHEFLAEDEGDRTRISIKVDGAWEHATTVNTANQTAAEWIEANARPGDPRRWLSGAFSRPGEAEAFAIGATSDTADPAKDEALIALAATVGREHTVNLFRRWSEGKASMNRSEGN